MNDAKEVAKMWSHLKSNIRVKYLLLLSFAKSPSVKNKTKNKMQENEQQIWFARPRRI